ncbi:site-specific recombinase XerD [Kribbella rubisoli]|uniref:Site-specific recombinase XerD n=1 Tax=Kribbella rubisoli TaxID=3075929 RepID=A0A4Q7WQA7_9ACTN|nr:site-specific integrase [Kribbella rubisoli]RZU12457.1 site-specific recombinase XerD [Kribbella rubisoli]
MGRATRSRSNFGSARRLPSGRWQARWTMPDGSKHTAPSTFDTKTDATAYLAAVRTDVARGTYTPPVKPQPAEVAGVTEYAAAWIAGRELAPRTRDHYRWLLDEYIAPAFGPLTEVTPAKVRTWHSGLATGPTAKAHAYALLKAIMATAVEDEVIEANPCRIRGASKAKRSRDIRPATLDELTAITKAMPARMRLLVPLSAWCALRFGECTELRRKDLDLKAGVVRIRRGVIRTTDGERHVTDPKTAAGKRTVAIPPHLIPAIRAHLRDHTQIGSEGLLFWGPRTGAQLPHSSLLWQFNQAKHKAGRDDLSPHALRHTGAVLAAQSGATVAELMARLGHTTAEMAMRYQHASEERDLVIARRLSELAAGN